MNIEEAGKTQRWAPGEGTQVERERDEWRARYRHEKKRRKRAEGRTRHWRRNHAQQVRRVRQIAAELKTNREEEFQRHLAEVEEEADE